jgi:hypothetical protein
VTNAPRPQAARREAPAAGREPEAGAKGPGEQGWGPRELRSRGGAARPVENTAMRATADVEGTP